MLLRGHLDAHLHGPATSLRLDAQRQRAATVAWFVVEVRHAAATTAAAHPPLVLDEQQDVAQREVGLALAAGQQVVLADPAHQAGHIDCWRALARLHLMIGLC